MVSRHSLPRNEPVLPPQLHCEMIVPCSIKHIITSIAAEQIRTIDHQQAADRESSNNLTV